MRWLGNSHQWMIDDLKDQIKTWKEFGLHKKYPDTFERMKRILELAKRRQAQKLNRERR